jgi:hypothetical protein
MRRMLLWLVPLIAGTGCIVHTHGDGDCSQETYDCYVEYTPGYGYQRVCDPAIDPVVCVDVGDDGSSGHYRPARSSSSSGGAAGSSSSSYGHAGSAGSAGSAGQEATGGMAGSGADGSALELPCTRDAQCGTGLCIGSQCFYGCSTDANCGTGDTCAQIESVSVCQANATPNVQCTRNAECGYQQVCLNAVCHDSCTVTTDCRNSLDRCVSDVCVPDRRIVSECLLDRDCDGGQVCVDATCQTL